MRHLGTASSFHAGNLNESPYMQSPHGYAKAAIPEAGFFTLNAR
jgi:hypothetical protein